MTVETEMLNPDLYDHTPEEDELYGFELQDDLSEEEVELAMKVVRWGLLRGIVIVTGAVGSGKDLFGNVVSWIVKRCFKKRKALRDEKPRQLYGLYEPFNSMAVAQELANVERLAEGMPKEVSREDVKLYKRITNLAEQWLDTGGEEKLAGGVLFLTEFWRYFHNRQPFNPMGIVTGAILKRWRHLDLLVIGNAPRKHELDNYSCKPYVTTEVRCSWKGNDVGLYRIFRTVYIGGAGVLRMSGKPKNIEIDGGAPRDFLGGKRWFDLFVSKSRSKISLSREAMTKL